MKVRQVNYSVTWRSPKIRRNRMKTKRALHLWNPQRVMPQQSLMEIISRIRQFKVIMSLRGPMIYSRLSVKYAHILLIKNSKYLVFCNVVILSVRSACKYWSRGIMANLWWAFSVQTAEKLSRSHLSIVFQKTNTCSWKSHRCSPWIYSRRMRPLKGWVLKANHW